MLPDNNTNKRRLFFMLVLMILVSTIPYYNNFMTTMLGHDLKFHLARIEGIYQGLSAGEFPVYINSVQAYGYGYASSIMNPQLFLYIPAVLRIFGFSLMNSYKIFVFLINAATVMIAYFSYSRIFSDPKSGVVASALYTFCLYRLMDVFSRSAIGECLGITFFPLILYGMYECIWGERRRWIWLALGFTGVIYSHILTVEIALGFCVIIGVIGIKELLQDKKRILSILKAAGISLLLSASFIIPWFTFISEDFNVHADNRSLSSSVTFISQMFEQFGSNIGRQWTGEKMLLSIGLMIPVGCLMFIWYRLGGNNSKVSDVVKISDNSENLENNKIGSNIILIENELRRNKYIIICLILGCIALWMSTNYFPWDWIQYEMPFHEFVNKFVSKIQFAWRFLGVASAFLVIPATTGFIKMFYHEQNKDRNARIEFIIVIIIMGMSFPYFDQLVETYTMDVEEKLEYEDGWTDKLYLYQGDEITSLGDRGKDIEYDSESIIEITDINKSGSTLSFTVFTSGDNEDLILNLPVYYYPGYQATCNGSNIKLYQADNNFVEIEILKDDISNCIGEVEIHYEANTSWKVANAISIISVLILILVAVVRYKRRLTWTVHEQ